MKNMIYKEVMDKLGAKTFRRELFDGSGQWIEAQCWTDDEEVMSRPAEFTVTTSWGEIGRFDNMNGELNTVLWALAADIEKALPGTQWGYSEAYNQFQQPEGCDQ